MSVVKEFLKGKEINEVMAVQAGKLAIENAVLLREKTNKLKQISAAVKNHY